MKVLIIQENGRHKENKNFRECFCLQRSFEKLNHNADVWGLGHNNYNETPNYESYDLIIKLENYLLRLFVFYVSQRKNIRLIILKYIKMILMLQNYHIN